MYTIMSNSQRYQRIDKQILSIVHFALHGVIVHLLVHARGGGKLLVHGTATFLLGGDAIQLTSKKADS